MDTKQTIEETALRLFSRKGYDAAGIQEIVEAAGITKPSLYHHFGSKEGLLSGLADRRFGELNAALREAALYAHDLPLNLRRTAELLFTAVRTEPLFFRLMLAMIHAPEESGGKKVFLPWIEEQYRILEELFAAASKDHGNMRGRSRAFAATFLGMVHTYARLYLDGEAELDDRLLHEAVRQFSYGIYS